MLGLCLTPQPIIVFTIIYSSNAVTAVTGSVDRRRIIYLTVGMEMRNRSRDGGRYAQDHHLHGDTDIRAYTPTTNLSGCFPDLELSPCQYQHCVALRLRD